MVSPQSKPYQLPLFILDQRCTRCGQLKSLDAFHRYGKRKNGRVAWCKACVSAYGKAYRDRNRERLAASDARRHAARTAEEYAAYLAYHRAYYASHRATILAQKKVYHEANKERDNRQRRVWHHAHKERAHAQNRAWHAAHPGYKDAYNKDYYQRTRPLRLAYRRAYSQAHPDRVRQTASQWRAKNRTAYALKQRRYKHLRRAAVGVWTYADLALIREAQRGRCAYCLAPLPQPFVVEHMTPISKKGTNWPWNLCLTCPRCNCRKGAMSAGQFLALLHRENC